MLLLDVSFTWLLYVVGIFAGLWVLGNAFTGPLQHWFIFRPRRLRQDFQYEFEAPFEELFLETPHRGRLNALWFKASQPAKGVVVFYHGNAGSLARWGHLHHFFIRHGYDFLTYDYRGYGKSTGPRSEKIMHSDALAFYDFARQYYEPEQIVLYGRSLGSAFAGRVAAEKPARLLVWETPFYSLANLFYTYYPFLPHLFYFRYRLSNARSLRRIHIPIIVFQGSGDLIVPHRCAARLLPLLKPSDAFYTVRGASHNNLLFYDLYNRKMEEALR